MREIPEPFKSQPYSSRSNAIRVARQHCWDLFGRSYEALILPRVCADTFSSPPIRQRRMVCMNGSGQRRAGIRHPVTSTTGHLLTIHKDLLRNAIERGKAAKFPIWQYKSMISLDLWKLVPNQWETNPPAIDIDELAIWIARVVAHQFAHYQQNLSAWGGTARL